MILVDVAEGYELEKIAMCCKCPGDLTLRNLPCIYVYNETLLRHVSSCYWSMASDIVLWIVILGFSIKLFESLLILPFLLCVYIFVWAGYVHPYVCTCGQRGKNNTVSFSFSLHLSFWDKVFYWTLKFANFFRLANQQGTNIFLSLSLKQWDYRYVRRWLASTWVMTIKLRFPCMLG